MSRRSNRRLPVTAARAVGDSTHMQPPASAPRRPSCCCLTRTSRWASTDPSWCTPSWRPRTSSAATRWCSPRSRCAPAAAASPSRRGGSRPALRCWSCCCRCARLAPHPAALGARGTAPRAACPLPATQRCCSLLASYELASGPRAAPHPARQHPGCLRNSAARPRSSAVHAERVLPRPCPASRAPPPPRLPCRPPPRRRRCPTAGGRRLLLCPSPSPGTSSRTALSPAVRVTTSSPLTRGTSWWAARCRPPGAPWLPTALLARSCVRPWWRPACDQCACRCAALLCPAGAVAHS
jgi:hypothetical protein